MRDLKTAYQLAAIVFISLLLLLTESLSLADNYNSKEDLYIPITPYRSVNKQSDACSHIGLSEETNKIIEITKNKQVNPKNLSSKVSLEFVNWYLKVLSDHSESSDWVRNHAKITRQAICQHLSGKVPETGFNMYTLADLNSIKIEIDGTKTSTENLQEYKRRSGYPKTNADLMLIPILRKLFFTKDHYIFPDKFFIARLKEIINGVRQVTEESPVLEIAAGHGVIAKELNRQNIPIIAIDNFSYKSLIESENPYVQADDAINAINVYLDHKVYFGFNFPVTLIKDIYETALSKSGPRILMHSGTSSAVYERRSEIISYLKKLIPNKHFYIDQFDIAVPLIYGYEPMTIVYSDDVNGDYREWEKNIETIKNVKTRVESLLANQIKGNGNFNRSPPAKNDEL